MLDRGRSEGEPLLRHGVLVRHLLEAVISSHLGDVIFEYKVLVIGSRAVTLLGWRNTIAILTWPHIIGIHPLVLRLEILQGRLARHLLLIVALQFVKQLIDIVCGDGLLVWHVWQNWFTLLHACPSLVRVPPGAVPLVSLIDITNLLLSIAACMFLP